MEFKDLLPETTLTASLSNVKGDKLALPNSVDSIIFQIIVSNRTGGDVSAVIEHSIDGSNWHTLISFTANINSNTAELKIPTTTVGGFVRSSHSTAVATALKAQIQVGYRSRK